MWLFVEMPPFRRNVADYLDDDELRLLQDALIEDPQLGDVIPGCAGVRKLRWGVEQRGKRGGCRVVYLAHPEVMRIDLMIICAKNRQEDLSSDEKKVLATLAEEMKREAMRSRGTQ